MAKPANAQTIPKPTVPELVSLTYADNSYYVTPTYGIDPFTGQNITSREGYYVNNPSVLTKVRNQPFTPYSYTVNNWTTYVNLYYNFRYKGHYVCMMGVFLPSIPKLVLALTDIQPCFTSSLIFQTITQYSEPRINLNFLFSQVPNGQIDFQVQAQIGRTESMGNGYFYFVGNSSDWSNTQKISIGETSSTSSNPTTISTQNPIPTPTVPEFPVTIALTFLAVAALAFAVVSRRKHLTGS